jgi:hypothetical protein
MKGFLARATFGVASTLALYLGVLFAGNYWGWLVGFLTALGYLVMVMTARPSKGGVT